MQVTKVTVRKFKKESLRAFADVLINNEIKIFDIRIIEGKKGLFVAMPQREVKAEGKINYYPYVRIDSAEALKEFKKAVLEAYQQAPETK